MFVNESQIIGTILATGTQTTTGSMFISLLLIMIFLFVLTFIFNISLEYSAVLFFPLLITYASYYQEFIGVLGATIIYLSIIISKDFFFK